MSASMELKKGLPATSTASSGHPCAQSAPLSTAFDLAKTVTRLMMQHRHLQSPKSLENDVELDVSRLFRLREPGLLRTRRIVSRC